MIKCYRDEKHPNGCIVEDDGDLIELTTDFVCIASWLLHKGAPMEVLVRSLTTAEKYQKEWKEYDKG